jgi:predicted nuclease with RNAse H fold
MIIAAGIDVGGPRKGFHAVVLRDGRYFDRFHWLEAAGMASWVKRVEARAVGVDAPCRWRTGGLARAAERELARLGIRCFATPRREAGEANPFYAWMRNGLSLYERLAARPAGYPLLAGPAPAGREAERVCFETFPQAVACLLAGRLLSAANKRTERRGVLEAAGIGTGELGSLDLVDAALCAAAAHRYLLGDYRMLGDAEGGFLVLPCGP